MRERKLESLRRMETEAGQMPPTIAYNPGTMTDPLPAVERAMAAFRRRIRGNPLAAYAQARAVMGELRPLAAEVFGGTEGEWAFADGHTATIDRLADSLAGILVGAAVYSTDGEHVGGVGAFAADPRFKLVQVSPEAIVDTPGRLYFLSHLTWDTNRDLSAQIRALVRRPDAPIVVVDGTQALGQIDVDVASLGCHAYLASGHKWLGGPHGSGLLYLRRDVIEEWPCPFRAGEPLCPDLPIGRWEPRGGQDFSRIAGIAAAVRAFQCHARPGRPVRERFEAKVKAVLGVRARVSTASAVDGRVVALELAGMDVYPVYRALAERGVAVKCVKTRGKNPAGEGIEALRIGFPWWADEEDIDRAVELLGSVVEEMQEVPALAGRAPQERGQLRAVSTIQTRRAVEAL